MSRAAKIEAWATLDDVQRIVGCERTKATEIIRTQLGGFRPAGLRAWRCTWQALREYKRKQEQQGAAWNKDFPSSPEKPRAEPTGIATSAPQMTDESSALSTSETTAAQNPERQPSQPSGTSRHVQRMASLLEKQSKPSTV